MFDLTFATANVLTLRETARGTVQEASLMVRGRSKALQYQFERAGVALLDGGCAAVPLAPDHLPDLRGEDLPDNSVGDHHELRAALHRHCIRLPLPDI